MGENQIRRNPIPTETMIQPETRIDGIDRIEEETRNDGIERPTGETGETGETGTPNGTTTRITGAREIRIRTCVRRNKIRSVERNELNARHKLSNAKHWRLRSSATRILE